MADDHTGKERMMGLLRLVGIFGGVSVPLAIAIFMATAGASGASGPFKIHDPQLPRQKGEPPPLVLPLNVTDEQVAYRPHSAGAPVMRADGRPVGYLRTLPAGFQAVEAGFLPEVGPPPSPDQVALTILGHMRYSGNNRSVTVTTVQLTPAAAQRTLLLGSEKIALADGSFAYGSPNRIVAVRGGLLVVIQGALAPDELKKLMDDVVLQP